MSQRISVFISSTSKDLEAIREEISDVIVSLNMFPITMKAFHPSEDNPVQISYDKLQQADMFIGIYANRYGYMPDTSLPYRTQSGEERIPSGQKSITHMEYEWALEREMPMMLYVMQGDQVPASTDADDLARMEAFKAHILKQHVVGFFESQNELSKKVAIALGTSEKTRQSDARRSDVESRLLQLVETWWIKGALETSLHDQIQIDLDYRIDASNPFEGIYHNPTEEQLEIVQKAQLLEVFQRFGQRLLFLGMPGSGKTITLLDTARRLIEQARKKSDYRLPVIFNLSSWQTGLTIAQWLVLELVSKYNIPRRDAEGWVVKDRLICLLDGLDEVEAEHRKACVDALNAHLGEYNASVIVCCREQEYAALNQRLNVAGIVTIQPLRLVQVNHYLERFGSEYQTLQARINGDETLGTIVLNPLMLYIAVVAHKNIPADELNQGNSKADWFEYLFNTYLSQILQHRPEKERRYILTNLEWLSQQLVEQSRSIFYIDQMGTEMLKQRNLRIGIQALTWLLYGGVAIMTLILAYNIGWYMAFGPEWGVAWQVSIPTAIAIWLVTWASAGLLVRQLSLDQIDIIVSRQWSLENIREDMLSGIVRGAFWGVVTGVSSALLLPLTGFVGYGLFGFNLLTMAVIGGGLAALLFAVELGVVFQRVRGFGLWGSLVMGMLGGILFGFVCDFSTRFFPIEEALGIPRDYYRLLMYSLPSGLAIGLAAGITRTWNYFLRYGLNVTTAEESTLVMAPTLKQTARNAQIFTLIFAVAGAISGVLVTVVVMYAADFAGAFGTRGPIWTVIGLPFPVVVAIGGAVIFGMAAFREFGGLVAIQRILTRLTLRLQGHIPAHYDDFLDDLAAQRLLHKVGIGYRFFHDLFQNHLASGKARAIR